ncbi:LysR family transcriptional regulator [Paracandidimonas soli]|uniref:DNA-binding transcriptional LysR family regulator n=1 Tax=Paracandidimonas soli TaxID=1917182 RepID=A0A4R3UT96_9BURK|nr:LysR family transcriptional regulator [Paracandidimonas soli]TCU93658.1 DNA-binding transcriptional LysR family regulator [Paracandidimonas soli]
MADKIDIQTLRLFLKIAELGNISRAADACGLSQPSVSRSLKALEQSLNAPLFHRTGHGVQPTAIGALAIERARMVVDGCDGFVRDIREQANGPSGIVSVALLTAYMRAFAADLFDEVRRKYPGVMLRMVESFSVQHEEWLAKGQVDIALITQYRAPRVANEDVLAQSDLALVGQKPPTADKSDILFRDLNGLPLVLPATPNGLRVRMEEEAHRQGVQLRVIFEADSLEAQLALIRRYDCYAIWSEHLVRQENYDSEFHACRITQPSLPRYVVLRTTTHPPLSRAAREVALILRRLIGNAHQICNNNGPCS